MGKKKKTQAIEASILHKIIGWSMILTGMMYPFIERYSIVQLFIDTFGEGGLLVWSVLMIAFGGMLILRPALRYTFIFTSPLLVFVGITMVMAIEGRSLTAMIYYVSLWLFPNYFDYRKLAVDYDDTWRKRLICWYQPKWVLATILLLMFAVLMIKPFGSGLDYIYYRLRYFDDPVTVYRAMFGVSGLLMLSPRVQSKFTIGVLCLAMFVHGGIFVEAIVTETYAWALLPFFLGNSLAWLSAIEEA